MPFPSPRAALLAALMLTGCVPDPPTVPPQDERGPNEVRGSRVLHYRTDQGDFTQPISDPSAAPLEAFSLGAQGLLPLTVMSSKEGTFRIPDAPAGKYLLRLGTLHLVTDSRDVNLDDYELGRQDAHTLGDSRPYASVTVSQFPAQDAESYPRWQVVSSNVGVSAELSVLRPVPAGVSSVANHLADYYQYSPIEQVLVEASYGDLTYFTGSASRSTQDVVYEAVDRFFTQQLQMSAVPSESIPLKGVFQELPTKTLTVDWRRSAFHAYRAQVHPNATDIPRTVAILPTAGSADAWYGYSGELMSGSVGKAGTSDAASWDSVCEFLSQVIQEANRIVPMSLEAENALKSKPIPPTHVLIDLTLTCSL